MRKGHGGYVCLSRKEVSRLADTTSCYGFEFDMDLIMIVTTMNVVLQDPGVLIKDPGAIFFQDQSTTKRFFIKTMDENVEIISNQQPSLPPLILLEAAADDLHHHHHHGA